MEDVCVAAHQVGGHAGEGNWQVIEALDLGVRQRNLVENQRNLLAGVESLGKLQSLAQSKLEAVGIVAGVFLAAERQIVKRSLSGQHLVPVDAVDNLAEFGSIAPGGVHSADQSAHAGARDVIDGNVMLFHPGDHTYVRQAVCAAALQS